MLAREISDDRGYALLLFIMKVSSWDTYMHVYHNLLCDKVNGFCYNSPGYTLQQPAAVFTEKLFKCDYISAFD